MVQISELYLFIALRSTAQLISYELILSSAILLVVLLTSSLNLTINIEAQKAIWFIVPIFPIFLIFFIGSVAETNRAPFDLAEALYILIRSFKYITIGLKRPIYPIFFKLFSSINPSDIEPNLDPYWITGFTDAKGCFSIKYTQSSEYNIKWTVQAQFQIKLHERDLVFLNRIKNFFGVGTIVKHGMYIAYTVKTIKNLTEFIIPHFNNFPLLTKKFADFVLFKQIVYIMVNKGHLNSRRFKDILSLRANLNLGMSDVLKTAFPDIVAVDRPEVPLRAIYAPYWLTGFIDGEGCFYINIQKYSFKTNNLRTDKAWLTFQITQHSRDTLFMESIIKYLNCGRIRNRKFTPTVDFLVNNYVDIKTKIISFLEKYPLQSVKRIDFADFCKAAEIIGSKKHLTLNGIGEIKIIKAGMNKKRLSYL